jgi:hypothetical protein
MKCTVWNVDKGEFNVKPKLAITREGRAPDFKEPGFAEARKLKSNLEYDDAVQFCEDNGVLYCENMSEIGMNPELQKTVFHTYGVWKLPKECNSRKYAVDVVYICRSGFSPYGLTSALSSKMISADDYWKLELGGDLVYEKALELARSTGLFVVSCTAKFVSIGACVEFPDYSALKDDSIDTLARLDLLSKFLKNFNNHETAGARKSKTA